MFKKISRAVVVDPASRFLDPHSRFAESLLDTAVAAPRTAPLAASRSAAWAPAADRRIRVVEGAVLVALMGYFGYGLLSVLLGA